MESSRLSALHEHLTSTRRVRGAHGGLGRVKGASAGDAVFKPSDPSLPKTALYLNFVRGPTLGPTESGPTEASTLSKASCSSDVNHRERPTSTTETASKKRRRSSVTCKNVSSKPDLSSEIKDTSPSKLQSLLLNSAASSCSFYKLLQDTTVKLSNKPSINLSEGILITHASGPIKSLKGFDVHNGTYCKERRSTICSFTGFVDSPGSWMVCKTLKNTFAVQAKKIKLKQTPHFSVQYSLPHLHSTL